jgi:glycerol-3-phosphate dehydrogenase (NAD(P)+)
MSRKIAFLGAGSFGTALAILLADKNQNIDIWDRNESVVNGINNNHKNIKYLKEEIIPINVKAHSSINDTVKDADYVVFSVPSEAIREVANKAKPYITKNQIIVNISKGIEDNTFLRISQVIGQVFPENHIVILSGPSHAEEVVKKIPTAVVSSSINIKAAEEVQDLFWEDYFRVYTNEDIIGVEIGGAVKNIIALAAGVLDGIGYGDNSKAALMTRGLSEIVGIGELLGAKRETFSGLTGLGDLIVTCTSMNSRNRRAGILIGQGYSKDEAVNKVGMVVEGITACRVFYHLKVKYQIDMPITDSLYNVLFNNKDPKEAVYQLMIREKKSEM